MRSFLFCFPVSSNTGVLVGVNLVLVFSSLPGEMIQFDVHIFQMGWFNHQTSFHH